jgi:hypothetical protein
LTREEIKKAIFDIMENMAIDKAYGTIMVGVVMPEIPHLDIPVNTPEQGTELAKRIHEATGLRTNARLATLSSVKYAKFPKETKKEVK